MFNNTVYNCQVGIIRHSAVAGSQVKNNVSINDALNVAFTDYLYLNSAPAQPQQRLVRRDLPPEPEARSARRRTPPTSAARPRERGLPPEGHLAQPVGIERRRSLGGCQPAGDERHRRRPAGAARHRCRRVLRDTGLLLVGTAAGRSLRDASATSGSSRSQAQRRTTSASATRSASASTLSAARYYITGRISSTVFTIQDSAAGGGTPGATNITFASTAITIRRAFNLLSTAEASSSDANHLNTANLVAGTSSSTGPATTTRR